MVASLPENHILLPKASLDFWGSAECHQGEEHTYIVRPLPPWELKAQFREGETQPQRTQLT